MLQKQFDEIETSSVVVAVHEAETLAIPSLSTGAWTISESPAPSLPTQSAEETLPIERLFRLLKWSRFMHVCPGSLTGTEPLSWRTVRFLQEVLAHFSDNRWRERTLAAWALGSNRIPPELEEEVIAALSDVLENRDARLLIPSRARRWLVRLFGVSATGVGMMLWHTQMSSTPSSLDDLAGLLVYCFPITCLVTLSLSPLVLPLGFLWDSRRTDTVRIAAANALGRLGRAESVGVLAKALFDRNPKVRAEAETAFRTILPNLTPAHYGHLTTDAVPNLCRALNYQETQLLGFPADQERLVYRVLEALGKVGDGRAVQPVQQIAATGMTTRIQEQAKRILPVLLARQRRENEPRVLLRATSMPSESPYHLLRPSAPSETDPPEQLLRPTAETA